MPIPSLCVCEFSRAAVAAKFRDSLMAHYESRLQRHLARASDGKANADVTRQLALAYKVPKSQVKLLRGASHREKGVSREAPRAKPEFLSLP